MPLQLMKKSYAYPLFLILLPVIFTIINIVGYTHAKHQYYEAGINALDKQMNTIFKVTSLFNNRVKDGQITIREAESTLKELLAGPKRPNGTRDDKEISFTLANGDTIFAFDSKGTLIMHPQIEGTNLFNVLNPEGRYLVREVMYEGNKVITYNWKNPIDGQQGPKIAFVRYFPQWDWYLCIATSEDTFYNQFNNVKYFLILLVFGSYVITAILFYLTRRKESALHRSTILGEELVQTNQSILKTLAVAMEERDSYTSGHSQRVAYYMRMIAEKMGFSNEMLDTIYTGGLLHDIGKIGIEDSILLKPGKLNDEEYLVIKSHPVRGEALLRKLYAQAPNQDTEQVTAILTITRSHHERFDGRGYPDQQQGDQIPLIARIAAVADSFDAMTSIRAYRKGFTFSKASDEILKNAGAQFCPRVVEAFFQSVTEETFFHAHQITRANELLFEKIEENDPMNRVVHSLSS